MPGRFGGELRMGQKAKDVQPVVGRDGHEAASGQGLTVIAGLGTIARNVAAAVKVDQHRQAGVRRIRGGPDIEVEAILADLVRTKVHVAKGTELHGTRAKSIGLAHTLPGLKRLGRLPAQVANRRGRKRDAAEHTQVALCGDALQRARSSANAC